MGIVPQTKWVASGMCLREGVRAGGARCGTATGERCAGAFGCGRRRRRRLSAVRPEAEGCAGADRHGRGIRAWVGPMTVRVSRRPREEPGGGVAEAKGLGRAGPHRLRADVSAVDSAPQLLRLAGTTTRGGRCAGAGDAPTACQWEGGRLGVRTGGTVGCCQGRSPGDGPASEAIADWAPGSATAGGWVLLMTGRSTPPSRG